MAPNLFREAFKDEHHVFATEGIKRHSDTAKSLGHPHRTPANTLNQYPVEVLAIKEDTIGRPPNDRYWVRWLERCTPENKPDYVIVAAPPRELVEDTGLQNKEWRRRFQRWGYEAHFWFLRGHEHGGVI